MNFFKIKFEQLYQLLQDERRSQTIKSNGCKLLYFCKQHNVWIQDGLIMFHLYKTLMSFALCIQIHKFCFCFIQPWKSHCIHANADKFGCELELGFRCCERPNDIFIVIGPAHGFIMALIRN